jgi:membrane protein
MNDDGMFDAAAQLAYYFMLALFPLIIFLISFLSTVQALNLVDTFLNTLRDVMPEQAYALLGGEIQRIMSERREGLLTFGAIGTLWAASSGVVSLLGSLNRAYDVEETRGFIKLRAIAIGLTVALALLIISGAVMLVAGDEVSGWLAEVTGFGWMTVVGTIAHYVIGLAFIFLGLEMIYYFGPDIPEQKWTWISPGAIVAAGLFVLASLGFSMYLNFSNTYNATYGSLGAVIILLLWLYIMGLAVTIGAEINSEIALAAKRRGHPDAPDVTPGPEGDVPEAARAEGAQAERGGGERTAERPAAEQPAPARPAAATPTPSAPPAAPPRLTPPPPTPAYTAAHKAVAEAPVPAGSAAKAAIADLVEMLRYENTQVRAGAVAALSRTTADVESALSILKGALADEAPVVRKEAAIALGHLGVAGVPPLVKALEDEDREVRLQAVRSLGEIGPAAKVALPALGEAARDADIADAALEARKAIERDPSSGVKSAA